MYYIASPISPDTPKKSNVLLIAHDIRSFSKTIGPSVCYHSVLESWGSIPLISYLAEILQITASLACSLESNPFA